jgi:hypothetical protein
MAAGVAVKLGGKARFPFLRPSRTVLASSVGTITDKVPTETQREKSFGRDRMEWDPRPAQLPIPRSSVPKVSQQKATETGTAESG